MLLVLVFSNVMSLLYLARVRSMELLLGAYGSSGGSQALGLNRYLVTPWLACPRCMIKSVQLIIAR